jgi:hypothetical protein
MQAVVVQVDLRLEMQLELPPRKASRSALSRARRSWARLFISSLKKLKRRG